MVVRIFPLVQHAVVTRVAWFLINHPAAALYADGVTPGEMGLQLSILTTALIVMALEVLFLKEDKLNNTFTDFLFDFFFFIFRLLCRAKAKRQNNTIVDSHFLVYILQLGLTYYTSYSQKCITFL